LAASVDQPFEPYDNRIAREPTTRQCEVGGRGAVTLAESAYTVGTEAAGTTSGTVDERFQFDPGWGSFGNELV
jgi:hypothetical protein